MRDPQGFTFGSIVGPFIAQQHACQQSVHGEVEAGHNSLPVVCPDYIGEESSRALFRNRSS